jgi:Tol biopolymer transport system component
MSLAPGARIGPYEVIARLGAGGMGEVFRARDTRLGRDVALKVLPAAFKEDEARLARFRREAQLLASLNDPHIAAIYGIEETDGIVALALELADGEDLSDRLKRGAIPLDEAVAIARQITEGLEAAHEKGIVHRDLKPANVKVGPDGKVKVLDFGLAKAWEVDAASGSSPELSNSPTLARTGTAAGMILGTAAYMSPEQARGKPADKRSDIWAFGVVMWEMLTGRRLFQGETVSDTLAAVLRADPEWTQLPTGTPAPIVELLQRCLDRDARRRLHDIADARIVLEDQASGRATASTIAMRVPPAAARPWLGWIVGFVLGAALMFGALALWGPAAPAPAAPVPVPTFRQLTRLPGSERHPSLSPDGESFAFVKDDGGDRDVFLQRVDGKRPILLTDDCAGNDFDPAFSPDGRYVAYRSECGGGGIFVMGATGESKRRVVDFGYQPAWSPDGRELAVVTERLEAPTSRNSTSALWVVEVDSGKKRQPTLHDAMGPSWSPDGRRIVFWGLRPDRSFQRDLFTVAADGSESAVEKAVALLDDKAVDWAPRWSTDGRFVWYSSSRGGTFNLWRVGVDPRTGKATGAPEPVTAPSSWAGPLSLARDGRRVAFVDRNAETIILRAPYDRASGKLGAPTPVFKGSFELREQTLSPDGASVLFTNEDLPQHLHVVRADGSGYRQLTESGERNRQGAWSPDGTRIAFQSMSPQGAIGIIQADGSGARILPVGQGLATPVWQPGGRLIAAHDNTRGPFVFDPDRVSGPDDMHRLPDLPDGSRLWPWAFTRDGRRILGSMERAGESVGIAIFTVADETYRTLTFPGESAPRGVPNLASRFLDEGRIFLSRGREIHLYDVDRGTSVKVYEAAPGQDVEYLTQSADGAWLSWVERADESDVWLLTLEGGPRP